MANYDYEIVNGRKIRVRPKETVSEIDKNGYFIVAQLSRQKSKIFIMN